MGVFDLFLIFFKSRIPAFLNFWLHSCLFWFGSRNLLLSCNSLVTRSSSLSLACSQCFFWSSQCDCVFIMAALHFCAASWMSSESLGLSDLWRNIVWPAGIGHLQGTVRINEGKKVLLIQYSSLDERMKCLQSCPDWTSDTVITVRDCMWIRVLFPASGMVEMCSTAYLILLPFPGCSLSVTRNVPARPLFFFWWVLIYPKWKLSTAAAESGGSPGSANAAASQPHRIWLHFFLKIENCWINKTPQSFCLWLLDVKLLYFW